MRHAGHGVVQPVVVHQLADQPVPVGRLGVDRVAEHEQLGGAAGADDARQQVGRAHVTAGQTDLREEEGEAGRPRDRHAGRMPARSTDPAPAAIPWMPQMIGTGTSRMARIRSPVILVKPMSSRGRIWISSPMISLTSPPAQKALPCAADHEHPHVVAIGQLQDQVAQVGVALEGQRVELLRAGSG